MIILWRITERCNYACGFCAYDRRLPGARREVPAAAVERLGTLLGDYRRRSGDRVLLSWLGGEPLLWPPLFEASLELSRRHGIRVSATTNGSQLHLARVRSAVLEAFSELTVSVDGFEDFHDRVRGCPGGWQRMRSGVSALANERVAQHAVLKLRANTVLMRDNVDAFPEFCLELATWGIDEITFNALGGRDRPEFFPDHALTTEDVAKIRAYMPTLKSALATRGVRLCGTEKYLRRIEAHAAHENLPVDDCRPGEAFLFVDETGRIAPCSFTGELYGVGAAEIKELAELPSRFRSLRAGAPASACRDCRSNHLFDKFVH